MSNSPLVEYIAISPNFAPREHVIDTITIHHMAGNMTVEECGALFGVGGKRASSNYAVGSDGRIAMYVEECNRSFCSSSPTNDDRAITVEVANDGGDESGWHVSDKALASLVELLCDVCARNNIPSLKWENNPEYIGMPEKQNMTIHCWFKQKICPGPYLLSKHGWIAEQVNKRLREKAETE
ncbi:MAG: N-acetylmuramoyl-L-alanine amidase [Ruminococcaceae bacterium]|nr:N-acetylmuramoyl-L-alanine amidase [Oscillospiraceae bacterium]